MICVKGRGSRKPTAYRGSVNLKASWRVNDNKKILWLESFRGKADAVVPAWKEGEEREYQLFGTEVSHAGVNDEICHFEGLSDNKNQRK